MEYAAIHHQPFSSDAYSYNGRTLHIKIRTKKDDAEHVRLVWGDPYEYTGGTWKANELAMAKIAATSTHDYRKTLCHGEAKILRRTIFSEGICRGSWTSWTIWKTWG